MKPKPLRRHTDAELAELAAPIVRDLTFYARRDGGEGTANDEAWVHDQTIALNRALKRIRRESLRRSRRRSRFA